LNLAPGDNTVGRLLVEGRLFQGVYFQGFKNELESRPLELGVMVRLRALGLGLGLTLGLGLGLGRGLRLGFL
jgi:hypothetical protein